MKKVLPISLIVNILLLSYVVVLRECASPQECAELTPSSTTIKDSTRFRDSVVVRFKEGGAEITAPQPLNVAQTDEGRFSSFTPSKGSPEGRGMNIYADTLSFDSLKIYYRAITEGRLSSIYLGYIDTRPERWKIKETTRTITNNYTQSLKHQIWIGAEAGGNLQAFNNLSLYARYGHNQNEYSYRYNIVDKTHNIGLGRRIFKR